MRWDNLFDDLESQLESELTAEEVDIQAEEERLRLARMSLRDRITAIHESQSVASGYSLRLVLLGGATIALRPVAFGKDWFSAEIIDDTSRRSQCIVPLVGISSLILDRTQMQRSLRVARGPDQPKGLSARLGLAFVLRDLCRRRHAVDIEVVHPGIAVSHLHGTIDRVGRDHLDLAVHERGVPRRQTAITQYRVVPLSSIQLLRL